jgi:hypothetical protein
MAGSVRCGLLIALAAAAASADGAAADDILPSPERPGNSTDDPIRRPKDLSGRSVKCPRVRAVHSTDPAEEGATAYLFRRDPWLAYQRGRELFVREFSAADGAFGEAGRMAGRALEDQATRFITRDHVASCALCHNVPFRDAGAGATIFKNGGTGRNTPHVFGGGLVEMLGWQIRLKLLERGDADRDGWIAKGESDHVRAVVENLPPAAVLPAESADRGSLDTARDRRETPPTGERISVDFGMFGDQDGDGRPDLNPVCFVWYVDQDGKRIPWARRLDDEGVAGYNFEVQVFGWGHGRAALAGRLPVLSTLRAFSANAFDLHAGLQAFDPTLNEEPAGDGFASVSLAGAQQFFTGRTRDRGTVRDARGVSRDDPDRDGELEELTEGDLDLIEFYQLNHPAPAEMERTPRRARGRGLFSSIGCVRCHVPDWHLEADNRQDPDPARRYVGDRRHFDLETAYNPDSGRLEGRLRRLTAVGTGGQEPRRDAFTVRGVYSDFVHHDLGPAFHQVQFDGSVIRQFKTPPLWGVGSTAPYGHDGASLDLDGVIRRHGGEAEREAGAYAALPEEDREAVLAFLRGLTLYAVDDLPCDVDGDGAISGHFIVAGQDTGRERLNPEWLFRTPGRIEGEVTNPLGERVISHALTNVEEAYGGRLRYLRDADGDGFPDERFKEAKGGGR